MGIHVIKMPDIGEGIAEVELVEWHVQPGDAVVEDQVLADVMTDKATVEIPSPVHGKVISLGGKVGDVMGVGTELIRLEVEGAGNVAAGAPPVTGRTSVPPAAAPAPPAASPPAAAEPAPAPPPSTPKRTPAPLAGPVMRAPGEKPVASPAVRRRAWELGVELQFVPGSGEAGRILHEDLDAYVAGRTSARPAGARYVESR